ncbi:MAG: hypothetical protein H7259_06280 [Cytophagales bacterium]|nr:hypothetical protein [Cytophaga sp.]
MCAIQILVIGRNEDILNTVVRLVNNNEEWSAIGVHADVEAMECIDRIPFELVLLTNGIDDTSEDLLRAHVHAIRPAASIIQHYGGGSGLLSNEIMYALNSKNL